MYISHYIINYKAPITYTLEYEHLNMAVCLELIP